jgi:phosphoserine phosphatase RsbU/P
VAGREEQRVATAGWHRGLLVLVPLGVLGVIVVVDALLPPAIVVTGAFGIAAIVASALVSVGQTALVAGVAALLTGLSALWHHNLGTVEWWVHLIGMVVIVALAMVLAEVRVRRERRLRHMTDIAETAQRALLRRMPRSIGSLGFAARYRSATQEAFVGGDLYEVVETEAGVRVIVGDVRGGASARRSGRVIPVRRRPAARPARTRLARPSRTGPRARACGSPRRRRGRSPGPVGRQ